MAQYRNIAVILSVHFSQLLLLLSIFHSTESSTTYPRVCTVDMAFVLDASVYVDPTQWTKTLSFLKNFAVRLDFGHKRYQTRIAVVTYGNGREVDIELNEHADVFSFAVALDAISIRDDISTLRSRLFKVRQRVFGTEGDRQRFAGDRQQVANVRFAGDRQQVANVVIIVTDRIPTDISATITEVENLNSNNIKLFAVGVGAAGNISRLAHTRMRLYTTDDYDSLQGMAETVSDAVCRTLFKSIKRRPKREGGGDSKSRAHGARKGGGDSKSGAHGAESAEKHDVEPIQKQSCLADLAFVLDSSGSVGSNGWNKMMTFMKDFTEKLEIGQNLGETSVGVVSFEDHAQVHFGFKKYNSVSSLHTAIDNIVYTAGKTNLAAGLRVMRTKLFKKKNGDRVEAPNIAILITDGVPTEEVDQTFIEARKARDSNIVIFGIGIGAEYNKTILARIANKPKENFLFFYDDFMKLVKQVDIVMGKACDPTITTPCGASDVAMLIDSSGSIGKENWKKTQAFVKDFASHLQPFGLYGNQIALISFSTKSELNAHLNTYDNYGSFASMVDGLEHRNHRTNISGAIITMYEDVFNERNGDRLDHGNIALILTDGHGNIDDHKTAKAAATARAKNIHMIVVGIGKESDMPELKKIVSKPKHSNLILIEDFSHLVDKATEVFLQACTGRSPTPTLEEAECSGDIAIVLDVGSNFADWNNLINALVGFVNMLLKSNPPVGVGGHRVALVVTAEGNNPDDYYIVYLYDYLNMDKFRNVPGSSRRSDTGKALEYIKNNVFIQSNGDRSDAQNVVIIFTDGRNSMTSDETQSKAQELLVDGVLIYTIGFDAKHSRPQWSSISSSPDSYFVKTVHGIYSLTELVDEMQLSICYATAKHLWFCSMEDGSFCNAAQHSNWQFGEYETKSLKTGPHRAHTGLKYAFIEASSEHKKQFGDTAVLYVPTSGSFGHHCLYFQYHMHGFHQGSLQVFTEHNQQTDLVWTVTGDQKNQWRFAAVQLNIHQYGKVLIRATLIKAEASHLGDTALDDIRLTKGPCLPLE